MSYTLLPSNSVSVNWSTAPSYTNTPPTTTDANFANTAQGTITGTTNYSSTVIAFLRNNTGLDLSYRYESVVDSNGNFTLYLPYPDRRYLVMEMSSNPTLNSRCFDWVLST